MLDRELNESQNNQLEGEEAPQVEDIGALRKALDEEKKKAEGCLASWQRVQADFINYKRRNEQEREDFVKSANAELIGSLLPALDDLERAFEAVPPELAENGWVNGMGLVERKFRNVLESQGITRMEVVGEPFDPRLHEAVRQGKGKEGVVVEEVQKG